MVQYYSSDTVNEYYVVQYSYYSSATVNEVYSVNIRQSWSHTLCGEFTMPFPLIDSAYL